MVTMNGSLALHDGMAFGTKDRVNERGQSTLCTAIQGSLMVRELSYLQLGLYLDAAKASIGFTTQQAMLSFSRLLQPVI